MDIALFYVVSILKLSLPYFIVMGLAVGGAWLTIASSMRVHWGAWTLAGALWLETWFILAPQIPVGIRLSSTDIAALLLLAGLAGRLLVTGLKFNRLLFITWMVAGLVMLVSFVRGVNLFGTTAGVELRENFYFWVAGLYFASFQYSEEDLKRLWRVLVVTAWIIVLIACYRWVGLAAGFVSRNLFLVAGASTEFRAVGSHAALFLAVTGMVYFSRWLDASRFRDGIWSLFFIGLVVILQHRSVWLATFFMLGVLLVARRDRLLQVLPWLAVGSVILAGLLASMVALGHFDTLFDAIATSFLSATSETKGTHTARIEGWRILLSEWVQYPVFDQLIGRPYGTGFSRYVFGVLNDFSPHNFYVELLLRVGALGLLLFVVVGVILAWGALRGRLAGIGFAGNRLAFSVLVGWAIFFISYQGNFVQGAGMGMFMAMLMASRQGGGARVARPLGARLATGAGL